MSNKHRSGFLVITKQYALKGSFSERYLLNLHTREKFTLDPEQDALLRMCDGQMTLPEILQDYDPASQRVSLHFLEYLQRIGAVSFTMDKSPRDFLKLVPDPQLQSVHFELTSRCNMRCLHCYQDSYLRKSKNLTLEEIRALACEMRKLQVEKVGVSGGEPFARPDLFNIIDILEENEIAISSILTNGLFLSEEVIEKLLSCRGRFSLFVSLDGMRPGTMKLRGFSSDKQKPVFERLVRNIRVTTNAGIPIMINTVVTRDNVDDLCQMYDWLRDIGVLGWRVALPKLAGAFRKHRRTFAISRDRVFKAYFKIIQRHLAAENPTSNRFRLQIEHFFRLEVFENLELLTPDAFVCDYEGKRQSCCIKPNGDVTPCPLYIDLAVGNVRQQSLESIWYSKTMREVKDIRVCDVEGCRPCSLSSLCATGCRANAIFLHGSKDAPDNDACAAVKFFIKRIMPLLEQRGINFPLLKDRS
jgi:radical SAM protein with 4Fe4S-binding SPASM domain